MLKGLDKTLAYSVHVSFFLLWGALISTKSWEVDRLSRGLAALALCNSSMNFKEGR